MKPIDLFVIGSGPAGQKAAIQAAKAGWRVAICERLREVGGACVHQGTIPSKALRERAVERAVALRRLAKMDVSVKEAKTSVAELIGEMGDVIRAHDQYMSEQLLRNGVQIVHGRASFEDAEHVSVQFPSGERERFQARHFVIATGSRPRDLPNVPVDHENIYDSDSILSLAYLPESLVVLGGGVIACEYASIFALLGVRVTLLDRYPRPLGFLDPDLCAHFIDSFERNGGAFLGDREVASVAFDGISQVETRLQSGTVIRSQKVLCALGRVAQVKGLGLDRIGVVVNERGLIDVNRHGQTALPHIYAAGDVIGPPSLASASMEQGRRVACHMLGIDPGRQGDLIPSGIYAVPELASVGMTETQALAEYGQVATGYSYFREIARGHISGNPDGMLKLVVSADGIIRGVHIVGAQATDLIHIGQMALLQDASVSVFVENVFNFPTYAESYRVAALQAAANLRELQASSNVA